MASQDGDDAVKNTSRRTILRAMGGLGVIGVGSQVAGAQQTDDSSDEETTRAETEGETYVKTTLNDEMENLVDLSIASDGRVFYITRGAYFRESIDGVAEIGVIDPESGESTVALELDVFSGVGLEDGGQGIALDPDFEENGWVYVYYSPSNEEIADTAEELEYLDEAGADGDSVARPPVVSLEDPYNQLSRFTVEDGDIDPGSEVEMLEVPVQRDMCCHVGGDIQFGPDGENLYLTTGDNTYSRAETDTPGFAPMDEREGRDYFDAQRTSGDTSDLRGKILRITPQEDGSYTVPDDNLFTGEEYANAGGLGEDPVRPEIYVMGARNPFQSSVDPETGTLFWGDYAPDSREWSATRGPPGFNEFNRAASAGNYGWPYFTGPYPFFDYDYEAEEQGDLLEADSLVNDSPHSDGLEELPPARDPFIYYPGRWDVLDDVPDYVDLRNDGEPPFPDLEGGAPIGGPLFRHEGGFTERGIPESYDGRLFIAEWGGNWIKTVSFEDNVADGEVSEIRSFVPDIDFRSPIDIEVGPEGMLYVAEYGEGYTGDGSAVSRIERRGSADGSGDTGGSAANESAGSGDVGDGSAGNGTVDNESADGETVGNESAGNETIGNESAQNGSDSL